MSLTKAGMLYITMTLVMGFAAVNTGNNLLFLVVSALLAFMAVSGVMGWLNIRRLEVQVTLPDEIYSNMDTLATVTVRNANQKVPSFLIEVRVLGRHFLFHYLGAGAEASMSSVVNFSGRGEHTVGFVQVCSRFPINFFVRCNGFVVNKVITVFPAPRYCVTLPGAGEGKRGGYVPDRAAGYEGDILRIADYSGIEPMKFIHWRLSAKHDELKVKVHEMLAAEPVIINLEEVPPGRIEEVLSCAAYLINTLIRDKKRVGLRTPHVTIEPGESRGHRLKMLMELAYYGKL